MSLHSEYDNLFLSLQPVGGKLSAERATTFFSSHGLAPGVLNSLWRTADVDKDGYLSREEFIQAMVMLSQHRGGHSAEVFSSHTLYGQTTGRVRVCSSAHCMHNYGNTEVDQAGQSFAKPFPREDCPSWIVPEFSAVKYGNIFKLRDSQKTGRLDGKVLGPLLEKSNVPRHILKSIWSMVDRSSCGRLTCEEFIAAMHLADCMKTGHTLPGDLPPELKQWMTASSNRRTCQNSLMSRPRTGKQTSSLEDRKYENFVQSRAILADRRKIYAAANHGSSSSLSNFDTITNFRHRPQSATPPAGFLSSSKHSLFAQSSRESLGKITVTPDLWQPCTPKMEKEKKHLKSQLAKCRGEVSSLQNTLLVLSKRRDSAVSDVQRIRREMQAARQDLSKLIKQQQVLTTEQSSRGAIEAQAAEAKVRVEKLRLAHSISRKNVAVKLAEKEKHESYLKMLNETVVRESVKRHQQVMLQIQETVPKSGTDQVKKGPCVGTSTPGPVNKKLEAALQAINSSIVVSGPTAKKALQKVSGVADVGKENTESLKSSRESSVSSGLSLTFLGDTSHIKAGSVGEESKDRVDSFEGDMLASLQLRTKHRNISVNTSAKPVNSPFNTLPVSSSLPSQSFHSLFDHQQATKAQVDGDLHQQAMNTQANDGFHKAANLDCSDFWSKTTSTSPAAIGSLFDSNAEIGGDRSLKCDQLLDLPSDFGQGVSSVNLDQLVCEIEQSGLIRDHRQLVRKYKNCFVGRELIDWLVKKRNVSRPKAMSFATQLLASGKAEGISRANHFEDDNSVYRLVKATTGLDKLKKVSAFVTVKRYAAQGEKELDFKKGKIIVMLKAPTKGRDGWEYGECSGHVGWFPLSHVQQLGASQGQVLFRPSSCDLLTDSRSSPLLPTFDDRTSPLLPTTLPVYTSDLQVDNMDGDVTPTTRMWLNETPESALKGNDSPLLGERKQYVSEEEKDSVHSLSVAEGDSPDCIGKDRQQMSLQNLRRESTSKKVVAMVIKPYKAISSDELDLQSGQLIKVKYRPDDGLWFGELQARGKTKRGGYFPSDRVRVLVRRQSIKISPMDSPGSVEPVEAECAAGEDDNSTQLEIPEDAVGEDMVALYAFEAGGENELSFAKDARLTVYNKEGEWWLAQLVDGSVGYVPYNYITPTVDQSPTITTWSNTVHQSVLDSLDKREISRQNAIFELIMTEEKYVNDLQMIIEVCVQPLQRLGLSETNEIEQLFSSWTDLYTSNSAFLKLLRERQSNHPGKPIPAIGDILLRLSKLNGYVKFCSGQARLQTLWSELYHKNTTFRDWIEECSTNKRLCNLPPPYYLVKPMQRITKYPLLILQVKKHTLSYDSDDAQLAEAHEKVCQLNNEVNEAVREQAYILRMEELDSQVTGWKESPSINSFTNSHGLRRLLFEGRLSKATSGRELHVFLFTDALLLTKRHEKSVRAGRDVKFEVYRSLISVGDITAEAVSAEEAGNDHSLSIKSKDKVTCFAAETKEKRNYWVNKINEAKKNFLKYYRQLSHDAENALQEAISSCVALVCVAMLEAKDLKSPSGSANPYVRVSIGKQKFLSRIAVDTLNPHWMDTEVVYFPIADLATTSIEFTVLSHNHFFPDEVLGSAKVGTFALVQSNAPPWKQTLLLGNDLGKLRVLIDIKLLFAG